MEVIDAVETLYQCGDAVRVVLLAPGAETDALIGVFERAAAELSWQPGDQLLAYRDAARHLAVTVGGKIVGGLQAVAREGRVLPSRRVWPEVVISGPFAHVTILALEREWRGRPGLFGPLCVELWRWCVAEGVGQIVIEATPPTFRLYRRIGWPLEVVGGLRPHWGEECYLCRMGVEEVAGALAEKACRSASHRALVEQAYRDGVAGPSHAPLTEAMPF